MGGHKNFRISYVFWRSSILSLHLVPFFPCVRFRLDEKHVRKERNHWSAKKYLQEKLRKQWNFLSKPNLSTAPFIYSLDQFYLFLSILKIILQLDDADVKEFASWRKFEQFSLIQVHINYLPYFINGNETIRLLWV